MPDGKKIKQMRHQRGMSQKQLGERCGIADSTIRKYESGRLNPKLETLYKIANALGCNVNALGAEVDQGEQLQHLFDKMVKDLPKTKLLESFDRLNPTGQQRAVSAVEDLAKVPEYQKTSEPAPAQQQKDPAGE